MTGPNKKQEDSRRCSDYLSDVLDEEFFRFLSCRIRHLKCVPEITKHSRGDPEHITANELHQKYQDITHCFHIKNATSTYKYVWEYLYLDRRLLSMAEIIDSFL